MKLLINGSDYTSALDAAQPLTIERTLNTPSACRFVLSLPCDMSLAVPGRMQRVIVTTDDDIVRFTGYIAVTPVPVFAGRVVEGSHSRLLVQAVSDEILLDQAQLTGLPGAAAQSVSAWMMTLVARAASNALAANALGLDAPVSCVKAQPNTLFSKAAGQVAQQAGAAYRALNGILDLAAIPRVVHALSESDGTLTPSRLAFNLHTRRTLASDITVCGEHEPTAYVTEFFQGDGTTTQFYLSETPYFPPASQSVIVKELFNEPTVDARVWNGAADTYFAIGGGGLTFNGGAGIDGQTQLAFRDPIEVGGTLLLEAEGIALAAASTGILAGFFAGAKSIDGCVAGFQITAQQGTGTVNVQSLVWGAASGTVYPIDAARLYTLRIRVHCAEHERTLATYRTFCDDEMIAVGGQTIAAGANLQFEIQECVDGVLGMPITLYECKLDSLPAACTLVVASSLNLHGSMRAMKLMSLGSAWVVSTPPGGSAHTRRIGSLTQSAECEVARGGKQVFYTGFTPAIGELIEVHYRTSGRAAGRTVNANVAQAASWIGTAKDPVARSSADCRNAAAALVQAASSESALWSGTYRTTQFELKQDVWPGDALAVNAPSCGVNTQMIARTVKVTVHPTVPNLVEYAITFANGWAEDLAITTTESVPSDVWLPIPAASAYLACLSNLTVTVGGNSLTINTGITPPEAGGFEVRRRDGVFMPGVDADLVLRGTQQTLIVARTSASERYYVRMFDGCTPPNYSEFSAGVFVNVPLDSGK